MKKLFVLFVLASLGSGVLAQTRANGSGTIDTPIGPSTFTLSARFVGGHPIGSSTYRLIDGAQPNKVLVSVTMSASTIAFGSGVVIMSGPGILFFQGQSHPTTVLVEGIDILGGDFYFLQSTWGPFTISSTITTGNIIVQ